MEIVESLFRWIHVVAGIIWIGHLYFFNFVNSAFAPTLDADSKKKVVPELMPRALYWFRWGAAWTWVSGVLLLLMVFYHGKLVLDDPAGGWSAPVLLLIAFTFLAPFLYDVLVKTVLKDLKVLFFAGAVLSTLVVYAMAWAGFGQRGWSIHLGVMFGTIMAFNVWYRIWPAQQKIIAAVKAGTAPDPALVALAGGRSKHNTYLSVPLVFLMLNQHATWTSGKPWMVLILILVAWHTVMMLYKRAAKVPGF